MDNLSGRVVVVTGGASGIGYGLAERFIAEGMKVVIADIESGALDRAVSRLSQKGEVLGHRTDVSSCESLQSLADAAVARFGAVHLLCNNAGVGGFQHFDASSKEYWDWIIGVNLCGVIHGCRIFMPILRLQDEAHIVNTASMSGFVYGPYLHPYNVSKAGVVALTEGMYRELTRERINVGVSVLCPAFTATAIDSDERNAPTQVKHREAADPSLAELRKIVSALNQAGKTPAEIADYTVKGIRSKALHIFPHPGWLDAVEDRFKRIFAGQPVGDEPAHVVADPRR